MVTKRIISALRVLTSKQYYVVTQSRINPQFTSAVYGSGNLTEMVLLAAALRRDYDSVVTKIESVATDAGELRLLESIRDAVDKLMPEEK